VVELNRRDLKTPADLANARIENTHKTEDKYGIFCPGPRCPHFSQTIKYPRKCFYEPQCWKGWLDVVLMLVRAKFQKR